jgi:hypothetical protein
MQRLNGEDTVLKCKPDALGRPTRQGGQPDFIFEDGTGRRYVIELTRLLDPRLRKIEQYLKNTSANL